MHEMKKKRKEKEKNNNADVMIAFLKSRDQI